MKKIIILAAMAICFTALLEAGNYNVKVTLPDDFNGAMAYLTDYDTGNGIDSVLVDEGIAEFRGVIAEPVAVRLIVDGNRMAQFVLEDTEIAVDPKQGTVKGGRLNEVNDEFNSRVMQLSEQMRNASTEQEQEAIYDKYNALADSVMNANLTNPVGYLVFLDKAYDFEPAQLEAFVAANPYFGKYTRVQKLLQNNRNKLATSEGAKFADFEIEYDGVKHRLSDVVGKGDYVLVDFWASWCGPCIRQTAVLKEIYNEYKDKGLKILGVAVWDEPENTKKAIIQHELPWESWLNGGNIPTDVYGISGIPCIILFAPDGTILSRDKQSEELKAAVKAALADK